MGRSRGRRRRLIGLLAVLLLSTLGLTACDGEEPTDRTFDYAALGDSYTAAPWLPTSSTDGCARSDNNYPHLVAEALEGDELIDVSCGGATAADVIQSQDQGDRVHPPQLDAVSGATDLVTLGMGVNDMGFSYTASYECLLLAEADPRGSPCKDANAQKLPAMLDKIHVGLVEVLQAITDRAPDARVLMIGYPRLLPDSGGCSDRLPLAPGDLDFVRQSLERLNATIESAADEAGVEYVDVAGASRGHDVCSERPWINGDRKDRRTKAAPYHPTPAEQAAVAELILDLL